MAANYYRDTGKRLLDVVAAGTGLVLASPLLLAAGIAIRVTSQGPVFFRQRRIGLRSRPFEVIKLRTMVNGTEGKGTLTVRGDPRVTPVGRWLRRSKIDEIPQLINVLRGEMSLVGPRPETPDHVAHYTPRQMSVLDLKPGLTGAATITLLDEERILAAQTNVEQFYLTTLLPQKLEYELAYCSHVTFRSDLALILATLAKLFMREFNKTYQDVGEGLT
jgi:lipopolysaccharide/colanic/teichoic acid biosynthesis glycosyltransferase